jgi:hypothetical protein
MYEILQCSVVCVWKELIAVRKSHLQLENA